MQQVFGLRLFPCSQTRWKHQEGTGVQQYSYHQSCLWRLIFWDLNISSGKEISVGGCRLCAEGQGHCSRFGGFVFPGLSSTVCSWLELERWGLLCVITRLNCWNCLKDGLYITLVAFITFSSRWKKAAECCTSLIKSHNYSSAVMS